MGRTSQSSDNVTDIGEVDGSEGSPAGTMELPLEGSSMTEQVTPDLVMTIDQALERFGARDLVAGAEVVDFLLDLRLEVVNSSDRAIAQLLDEERQPTA